ncbi:MAG: DUF4393 domain-containing protein [Bacteroidetes bacterium]|nr:DUF4393 domain-containing protein [Bacteroidota bacterium]
MNPKDISNILGADTIKKIYEDGLSAPTKEVSKLLADFVKAARLFSAPIQLMASYQERLQRHLKDVSERVPKEKQINADSSFAGPIIERLTYLSDDNYLKDYYLNLLEKSINSDLVNLAHPAFPTIIHQLSPDEIKILEGLKSDDITISLEYEKDDKDEIVNERIIESNFELNTLSFPQHRSMYVDHLQLLNLIKITIPVREAFSPRNNKFHRTVNYTLFKFGKLFIKACSR